MNDIARVVVAMLLAMMLTACGQGGGDEATAPQEIKAGTSCALDGMLLSDYPGPKAQIHYAGRNEPDYFCDTVEMFSVYLHPEQVKAVRVIYVQDMGKTDWSNPVGQWIDARQAYFVVGSKKTGSMGPTFASFSTQASADKFAQENGGKVYPFSGITADMAALDGGALHDSVM